MVHANPYKKVDIEKDGFYKFNDAAITIINSLYDFNIEIILSTSHRFRFTISEWKNIFLGEILNLKKSLL
ncbi:hypothetical protein [Chryseobacterium paludis]|uniref:hypothetical protein n=1 Tax=Chryseobacterium paludis TaxID=2956784 RepID=UPI0036F36B77